MNKLQLREYLESKFEIVIDNKGDKTNTEANKITLGIEPETIDDKTYIWIAEYICMNNKKEKFYFMYYTKKNTTMIFDETTKNIMVRLENNVTKRNQYELVLKKIKKLLPSSKSYFVIFSCGKVIFNTSNLKNKIFILNESNIEEILQKHFDN